MSVAVLIPTRNMAATLERAVLSAAGADEVHVIDDASTDDTQAVLARIPFRVHVWRWPVKSASWVSAMRVVYEAVAACQVVCLGADDELLPGFVDAVRDNAEHAVVFTDYLVVKPDGSPMWTVSQGVTEPTTLGPDQMCQRVQGDRNATETGIGSSLRSDVARWLWERAWERMGPHQDSVGYATAACLFGCRMLPMIGARYTFTDRSYGRDSVAATEDAIGWGKQCIEFTERAGLDVATARRMVFKRAGITWKYEQN